MTAFHLRVTYTSDHKQKSAAMTDDVKPLVASDTAQTTNVTSEGQLAIPTGTSAHGEGDRKEKSENPGNHTATNIHCGAAPGPNSEQTAQPSWEAELRQHKSTIKKLTLERDKLEKDSNRNYRLLEAMRTSNENLERQVRDLNLQLAEDSSRFRQQVITLGAEKRALVSEMPEAYRRGQLDGIRTQLATNEKVVLIQQIEAYKNEAAKWKQEALGQGSEMFNTRWQASVDEAVRRKREADSLAMGVLREELAALRAEKRK